MSILCNSECFCGCFWWHCSHSGKVSSLHQVVLVSCACPVRCDTVMISLVADLSVDAVVQGVDVVNCGLWQSTATPVLVVTSTRVSQEHKRARSVLTLWSCGSPARCYVVSSLRCSNQALLARKQVTVCFTKEYLLRLVCSRLRQDKQGSCQGWKKALSKKEVSLFFVSCPLQYFPAEAAVLLPVITLGVMCTWTVWKNDRVILTKTTESLCTQYHWCDLQLSLTPWAMLHLPLFLRVGWNVSSGRISLDHSVYKVHMWTNQHFRQITWKGFAFYCCLARFVHHRESYRSL